MDISPTKLLFDGTSTQSMTGIKFHGGSEYAKFMLRAMIDHDYAFDVAIDPARFLDDDTLDLLQTRLRGKVIEVDSKQELYRLIDTAGYDIFYAPLPYEYSDYNCQARLIAVIHGLRRIEAPWDTYRHFFFENNVKRIVGSLVSAVPALQRIIRNREIRTFGRILAIPRARFVTVSEHSKYSILRFFPHVKPDDIDVFYSPFKVSHNITERHHNGGYYLMVSANRYEKNTYRAAKAFDTLMSQGRLPGKHVVVTGTAGERFWKRLKCPNRFELLPYVDKEELDKLYRDAFCFVYPSLNEGFGYPPLQAMSYGVPVIASAATSIPEACDDAAVYFPPTNIDDLSTRILRVDNDPALRAEMTRRGFARVKTLQERQYSEITGHLQQLFRK